MISITIFLTCIKARFCCYILINIYLFALDAVRVGDLQIGLPGGFSKNTGHHGRREG